MEVQTKSLDSLKTQGISDLRSYPDVLLLASFIYIVIKLQPQLTHLFYKSKNSHRMIFRYLLTQVLELPSLKTFNLTNDNKTNFSRLSFPTSEAKVVFLVV